MLFTVTNFVKLYKIPIIGKIAQKIVLLLGADIPTDVIIGKNVRFPHNSVGTVIHNSTILGNNVRIYQNVTIGRSDIWKDAKDSEFEQFIIEDGAILCAGSKIIGKKGVLKVGKNTVIGANSVLLESTGENEIWCGIPAKKIGYRDDAINNKKNELF